MNDPSARRRPLSGLRSLVRAAPAPANGSATAGATVECCEICGEPITQAHSHVANVEEHRLLCACRPCYLLFTNPGAGRGRLRAVPASYRSNPGFRLTAAQWDTLRIPVDLAFIFRQSDLDRYVALYPSPGGATESLLDMESWDAIIATDTVLARLEPDLEAALIKRSSGGFECYVVPIDACYELVGIVRRYWAGFAGGEDVWQQIEAFFDIVRERSSGSV